MISTDFASTDQVAIITGAGRGIGAASAIALAECGADVVIASRTSVRPRPGRSRASRRSIAVASSVACDLADLAAIADARDRRAPGVRPRRRRREQRRAAPSRCPFSITTPEYMEEAFHFNVATAHALNLAAVPVMLEHGGGAIVNISSVMGRVDRTRLRRLRHRRRPPWPTTPDSSSTRPRARGSA